MNFTSKVVLITGAGSGIGAATSLKFAELGACLALTALEELQLQEISRKCSECGEKPIAMVGDVTKESDNENLISTVMEKYGKLDVLINNAGVMESGTLENTSMEQYDRTIRLNIRSMFHLTKLAAPHLIKTKGSIVNLSSICGIRAFPNLLAYNISKASVEQFTHCVGLELAPKGVRCNCINPGVILTNLHLYGGMDPESYQKFLRHSKTTHPLGRVGFPHEVADLITFLASDLASFTTASGVPIDGGRQALCPR